MEAMPPPDEPVRWTDELEFTHSEFEISSVPIKYYLTNVRLSSLEENFSLVEDIPGSVNWGYNAIFQRNIDHDRVEHELLNRYLLIEDKFKFFNPLTIALLPYDWDSNVVRDDYLGDWTDEGSSPPFTVKSRGGILIKSMPNTTVGRIKWDRDEIVGVAIDGQHRLSALMRYANHHDQPAGIDPTKVRIPVVLLVFETNDSTDIITQVREIFIDINKNAKKVSKSRQILLDDRDPFAVLARDLVKDGSNNVGLRYEVVDWKRESSKPEDFQLTTIVALYEIVRWMYNDNLSILESKLNLNKELEKQELSKIRASQDDTVLTEQQIEVALDRFRKSHKRFLLKVFQTLKPYEEFIGLMDDYLGESDADQVFKEFIFAEPHDRKDIIDTLESKGVAGDMIDSRRKKINNLKSENIGSELLFTSIGQRGLFYYYSKLERLYSRSEIVGFDNIASEYVNDLHCLIKNNFFERTKTISGFSIWSEICLRGDSIAVSRASAYRFSSLLLLAIAALRHGIIDMDGVTSLESPNLSPLFKRVREAYTKIWETRLLEDRSSPGDDDVDMDADDVEEMARSKASDTIKGILSSVSDWSD